MLTKADKSQQKPTYADKSTYQQKLTNADIKADKSRQKRTKAEKNWHKLTNADVGVGRFLSVSGVGGPHFGCLLLF